MLILYIIVTYILGGLVFSMIFLVRWIDKVDDATAETSWAFKLIILPGCIVFWPIMLRKTLIALKKS